MVHGYSCCSQDSWLHGGGCVIPKRVLDGEGFWGSRKLRRCPLWIRQEYPYLYCLADCNGSFEYDIPVILGKLKPNRPDLSERKLSEVFKTFQDEGIAFAWVVGGRAYLHWTGSERVGRLPRLSRRSNKYEKRLAPPIPQKEYLEYLQRFGETLNVSAPDAVGNQVRVRAKATDKAKEKNTAQASPSLSGFSTFWDIYPRKVGKPAAQRAFNGIKAPRPKFADLLQGLNRWKESEQWQKEDGKFIPYPATFLNQRRWEDEPLSEAEKDSARRTATIADLERIESKPGKCACGAEIPAGFLKCLKCMKKKVPVNP